MPGPDRGEGGKYLLLPPGYDGPLPDGGFSRGAVEHDARDASWAALSWRTTIPKPTVEMIKKTLKIYPYTPGGFGTSIATALEGKVRLGRTARPPRPSSSRRAESRSTRFPPSDFTFFEMLNAIVQQEPADALDPELHGPTGGHRHREGQAVQAGRADEEDSHRRGRRGQRRRRGR